MSGPSRRPPSRATARRLSSPPSPPWVKRYRTTTLTAHVANGVEPKEGIPTGKVVYRVDGKAAEPVTVNAAVDATLTLSWPTAGVHKITASFCPSSDDWVSSEAATKVTVSDEKTATAIALRINPASAVAWQPLTLSAGVTAAETDLPAMTGTVQFSDRRGPIGALVKL